MQTSVSLALQRQFLVWATKLTEQSSLNSQYIEQRWTDSVHMPALANQTLGLHSGNIISVNALELTRLASDGIQMCL